MNNKDRGGTLLIRTTGDQSDMEVSGSRLDIIFNWTALTNQVCKTIGLSPIAIAAMLPHLVDSLKYETKMEVKMEMEGKAHD